MSRLFQVTVSSKDYPTSRTVVGYDFEIATFVVEATDSESANKKVMEVWAPLLVKGDGVHAKFVGEILLP